MEERQARQRSQHLQRSGGLTLDILSGLEVQIRWDTESMSRNAGGEMDKAVGYLTLKDPKCHAKASRTHLVGNRELLKILNGAMIQNVSERFLGHRWKMGKTPGRGSLSKGANNKCPQWCIPHHPFPAHPHREEAADKQFLRTYCVFPALCYLHSEP